MWLLYAFLSSVSAAGVAILGKLGLQGVDSTLATTIRSVIMAIFLITVSVTLNKLNSQSLSSLSTKDLGLIIASGLCGAISWLFYFAALKEGIVSRVVVIDRLSFVFAIILSVLILHEKLNIVGIIGTILMSGGAMLITFSDRIQKLFE